MAKAATARKRVEVSEQTLALLQELADWYGHGDTKAALATLAKFGVPQLLGQGSLPSSAQTQIQPTPIHTPENNGKVAETLAATRVSHSKSSLAHQLGFRHLNDQGGLVANVLSSGSLAGYSEREKGSWLPVSDDCVMALANNLEDF